MRFILAFNDITSLFYDIDNRYKHHLGHRNDTVIR